VHILDTRGQAQARDLQPIGGGGQAESAGGRQAGARQRGKVRSLRPDARGVAGRAAGEIDDQVLRYAHAYLRPLSDDGTADRKGDRVGLVISHGRHSP